MDKGLEETHKNTYEGQWAYEKYSYSYSSSGKCKLKLQWSAMSYSLE